MQHCVETGKAPLSLSKTQFRHLQLLSIWKKFTLNGSLNGVLPRFQQYFSHIMATVHIIYVFLGFTSTRLGSRVSCPRILPRKNPEDPVWLEPRTPGLRVKHSTTEPRGTLEQVHDCLLIKK